MHVITLNPGDAERLNTSGYNKLPTRGAFRAGERVVVCKQGAVFVPEFWESKIECLCGSSTCSSVTSLPTRQKLSRSRQPNGPAPNERRSGVRLQNVRTYVTGDTEETRTGEQQETPSEGSRRGRGGAGFLIAGALAAAIGAGWMLLGVLRHHPQPLPPTVAAFASPQRATLLNGTVSANVRSGPGRSYGSLEVLAPGSAIVELGRASDSEGKPWIAVRRPDGSVGFIKERLIVAPSST